MSAAITSRLSAALAPIQRFLRRLAKSYGVVYEAGDQENFQLCLWLRRLDLASQAPTYALELLGSSTFQNREPWAMKRDVPISSDSPYAAAQAVFNGLPITTNLDQHKNSGLWHGVLAVPITVGGFTSREMVAGRPLDQLTVGALTLDSTYYVDGSEAAAGSDVARRLGVLSRLGEQHTNELLSLLYSAASAVLLGS
ncbi:hypothetical protein A5697_25470 [Mycobacterium sp. E3251]|nr:hypothetical protein A5697_25470 [Mycobacterium sp. E3251]